MRARIAAVFAIVFASATIARADDSRTADAPRLVPPQAIDAGEVPYPREAHGDATVIVELVVTAEGTVDEVRVVDGAEPFASAVREAAARWKFEAARRGETRIAGRVRMRVAFAEGRGESGRGNGNGNGNGSGSGSAGGGGSGSGSAGGSGSGGGNHAITPADDVHVRGVRRESGQTSLGGSEVRQIPGAFGDPFRAIESLPGVTPMVSGLPFFFVRGAPPGNTGYFIDGVRVPLLYHLGLGPSVVHPGLIDRVDFFPGAFPARYGRFAGGVLAGETLPPASRLHGEANVRLFDAGALVESPFGDGRGSVLVGGRYSYTAAILSRVAPDTSLAYWDYQTRATWRLGERDTIGVFAFGSYDYLGDRNERTGTVRDLFATQFHRVDVRYDHALAGGGNLRLATTLGSDATANDVAKVGDTLVGLRTEIDHPAARDLHVRAGADVVYDHYSLLQTKNADQAITAILYPPRDDVLMGAHADVVWRITPRVEVVPGLRVDLFNSHRLDHPPRYFPSFESGTPGRTPSQTESALPAIDPRLSTRVTIARPLTWVTTFGVSHQKPSFFLPLPGLQIGEIKPALQTSYQMSQGLEAALPAEFTATATVFLHDYIGLTDLTATCGNGNSEADARDLCVDERVRGRTLGLEILVRRALTKRITGWLAYTLSRSTRSAHVFGSARGSIATIPGEFDRTHVLNAVGAYDLGKGWRVGARFFFYTGRPYSQTLRGFPLPPYNSERLPAFYRFDVRIEKKWRIGETASIAMVLEGLNVTAHKEAVDADCYPTDSGLDRCAPEEVGPITIPSLGVEATF